MDKRKRKPYGRKMGMKLFFMLFLFMFSLVGLVGRVYYLKTVKGEEYETKAKEQQINRYDSIIPPNRGAIVDRNNQPLAISITVYNVILDSRMLSQLEGEEGEKAKESTLRALVEAFPNDLDYETLKHYITIDPSTKAPFLDSNWKVLIKGIDTKTKEALQPKVAKGCVVFEQASKRTYPGNTLACHVIGFGQWGLESQYNQYMVGTPGRSFLSYDGGDTAVGQDHPAKDGDTVITTLDYNIQQLAEEVVAEVALQWPSENVASIVMNPNTGEVYAMASANMFDLNKPSDPIGLANEEFKKGWEILSPDGRNKYRNGMWKNFNISDTFEPGSTYKAIVAAAALEENVIQENSTFFCTGKKIIADREIHCHLRTGHGTQTIEQALANSCNISVMDMAVALGKDKFYKYQRDFGIGEKTGIDLPGEPNERDLAALMFTPDRIGPTELGTMAFGQSFNCTSLQIINAFSATINGGKLMKPYLVSRIMDTDGNVVLENKPEVVRRVISQETSDFIRVAMKSTFETGTGKKMKIDGYSIGAKTGTSEQGSRQREDLWSFSTIAYFPAENPQYIVMTLIHRPYEYIEGVQSASPMTKKLIEGIIKYKNLEPSYETENASAKKELKQVKLEDFITQPLSNAISFLDFNNLNYKVIGTGNIITNQVPKGATTLDEGSEVMLYVKNEAGEEGFLAVPNVMGKTYSEGVTILNDAGFEVAFEGGTEGVVITQNPKHGVSVAEGTEVIITIGKPEAVEEEVAANADGSEASPVNRQNMALPFARLPEIEATAPVDPATEVPATGVPVTGVSETAVPTTGISSITVPEGEASTTGVSSITVPSITVPEGEASTTGVPVTVAPETLTNPFRVTISQIPIIGGQN